MIIEKKALSKKTREIIIDFLHWLKKYGNHSYDQYDFWATSYGQLSKKVFYSNKILGTPLVFPYVFLDNFSPRMRSKFRNKSRFPIADAHYSMGFLNLYKITGNNSYLKISESYLKSLLRSSIKTKNGISWGYPFDWQTSWGNYRRHTPLITTTPYCLEAFIDFTYNVKNNKYDKEILSIISALSKDFPNSFIDSKTLSSNYSSLEDNNNLIINASSYRAYGLSLGYSYTGNKSFIKACKNQAQPFSTGH